MKKISEFKGDKALDLIADLLEPMSEIMTDEEIKKAWKSSTKLKSAELILELHKKSIFEILAKMSETSVAEYKEKSNPVTLFRDVLSLMNDDELMAVFHSQEQSGAVTS